MSSTVTLVTGSSGFVGRVVVSRLAAAGHRAVGLDPVPAATTQVIDDLSGCDRLRSLLEREHVTHIIHAGGVSGPMVMADDPAGVIATNVTGSMNDRSSIASVRQRARSRRKACACPSVRPSPAAAA